MSLSFPNKENLPASAFALIIDSYSKVKVKVIVRANLLLAMPASVSTKKGKKDIFDVYTFFGKENKAYLNESI
jgi:hypothetical protein